MWHKENNQKVLTFVLVRPERQVGLRGHGYVSPTVFGGGLVGFQKTLESPWASQVSGLPRDQSLTKSYVRVWAEVVGVHVLLLT